MSKGASSLGLDSLGDLSSMMQASEEGILIIPLDDLSRNPEQPREYFADKELEELAQTIKLRGVQSPISVRNDPDNAGKYVINHGERRFRASKLAGAATIRAILDNDYTFSDAIIENEQREPLTALERAISYKKMQTDAKAKGEKATAKAVAGLLGLSEAKISQHLKLLKLPPEIDAVFKAGIITNVTLLGELANQYAVTPEEVMMLIEDEGAALTRQKLKELKELLAQGPRESGPLVDSIPDSYEEEAGYEEDEPSMPPQSKEPAEKDPNKFSKAIINVTHDERPARIDLTKRPEAEGYAWLKYEDDGQEFSASLASVTLVSVIEG